jgi:hypothetical protein
MHACVHLHAETQTHATHTDTTHTDTHTEMHIDTYTDTDIHRHTHICRCVHKWGTEVHRLGSPFYTHCNAIQREEGPAEPEFY